MSEAYFSYLDLGVVVVANLFNLTMIMIFLSRPFGMKEMERQLGWFSIGLGVLAGGAALVNLLSAREWWAWVLPALLAIFEFFEWSLDYHLKIAFRQSRLLGPYLFLFYIAQWGLIGYAFIVKDAYGFITLVTYFASMAATVYSYRKVGHGE